MRAEGFDGRAAEYQLVSAEKSDSPIALVAVILKWYLRPGVSPVT